MDAGAAMPGGPFAPPLHPQQDEGREERGMSGPPMQVCAGRRMGFLLDTCTGGSQGSLSAKICRARGSTWAAGRATLEAGAAGGAAACREGVSGGTARLPWTLRCWSGGGRARPPPCSASWSMCWCRRTWPAAR
jgi:hypothetical protein